MGIFMIKMCSGVVQRTIAGPQHLAGELGALVPEAVGCTSPNR